MARHLNGTASDRIVWGDVTFYDGLAACTTVGWVRPDFANSQTSADYWRKDGTATPIQRDQSNSVLQVAFWGNLTGPHIIIGSGYTWTTNVWHFCASTFDPANLTINFYAALQGDTSLTLAGSYGSLNVNDVLPNSAFLMRAGSNDAQSGEFAAGDIAFFGVVSQVLNTTQILAIKANPDAILGYGSNCKFYARLCGFDSPEPDASGNGNNGTLTGTTQATSPVDGICGVAVSPATISSLGWLG